MSVGGGTSGTSAFGKGKQKSQAGSQLENYAAAFFGETTPLRKQLISQFEKMLKTGGTQAVLPVISKAEEASKQATSRSLRQTDEELARQGLAGTPFGAMVKAETRQQGEQATSQIAPQMNLAAFNDLLNNIQNFVLTQGSTALSGLGPAVQGNLKTKGQQHAGTLTTQASGSIGGKG